LRSYRNRLDIVADVLHVVSRRARKTQIMYQANLSFTLLNKYLIEATEATLIRLDEKEGFFMLTPKGKRFLEKYREYSKTNKHVERQLKTVQTKRRTLEELCPSK